MLKEFFIINMVEKGAEKLITHAAKTSFNKNKSNNSQKSTTYNTYNTEIYNENPVAGSNTVSLVCAHCGGTMTIDKDSSVLMCPYCGSKELIRENDNVKIAKIKNDTQKEIEIKKMEYEERERERRYKEKEMESEGELLKIFMYFFVPIIFIVLIFALIHSTKNSNDEETQPTDPNMAAVSMSSSSFCYENYQSAMNSLKKSGFTNITCEPVYDIYFGVFSSEGEVSKIKINGITEFDKNETFPKDAEIIITYHLSYKDDPSYTETEATTLKDKNDNKDESTSATTTAVSKALSYSTNDKETAKDGNTGVYSYKSKGGEYNIYYIIDFDEGYVYRFIEGNGDETCDRLKIDSGDLNNGLIITYHDGNDTWSNGLRFKWQKQPNNLILEDSYHFETEFDCTNLNDALRLRDKKKIIDY